MSTLALRGLRYAYPDGTRALDGVDLTVTAGESVALVGPNGAGKSTLLLHLGGFLRGEGEVRLGDLVLGRRTLDAIRRRVGLVFQDPDDQLFLGTVRDDVAFGLVARGVPPEEAAARVDAILGELGLGAIAGRPPHHLSQGQKRLVALATVLVLAPDVLVLDEPSANLDPRGRRELVRHLQRLPMTRLVASHDLELVLDVCTRVVLLDGGRVVADGPAEVVLADAERMERHGLEVPHSLLPPGGHAHRHRHGV